MLPDGQARIVPRGVEGAPDLVVEVISPSNRAHDVRRKRVLYARAGIREYWLIDPQRRSLEILALDGDAYAVASFATGEDQPFSPLLGRLPFSVEPLFPDPALTEM